MALTEAVLNGLSLIFCTEVKDEASPAICQMLHQILVVSHKAAISDHFNSNFTSGTKPIASDDNDQLNSYKQGFD